MTGPEAGVTPAREAAVDGLAGPQQRYGGASARVDGSLIVSMRRMNRVLAVDDAGAYAVVEPGVRFLDLREHGHRLWPSSPDLGWGSVVGNTLEYGRGYTPYGDHASNACGLEVVLPSGEAMRTGMGAMSDSKSWHPYPWSFGPTHTGLFMQSNLGIVTKMGVWLMPVRTGAIRAGRECQRLRRSSALPR